MSKGYSSLKYRSGKERHGGSRAVFGIGSTGYLIMRIFWVLTGCLQIVLPAHGGLVPERIVSLSPNVTEIVFALGAGDRLVAVSRYCDYPREVSRLPRAGGFVDPDYEAIVTLQPDLVIMLDSHDAVAIELKKLGIATLKVPHRSVADVHRAIRMIGDVCGASARADSLISRLKHRTRIVSRAVSGLPRPRVLLSIGRSTSSGQIGAVYVAGRDGFFDRLIELAGGRNVCREARVAFPRVSPEGVMRLNPDVIVDLVNIQGEKNLSENELSGQWQALDGVSAVQNGRVHILTDTRPLRPGPRYVEFLCQLAKRLHPQADIPVSMP